MSGVKDGSIKNGLKNYPSNFETSFLSNSNTVMRSVIHRSRVASRYEQLQNLCDGDLKEPLDFHPLSLFIAAIWRKLDNMIVSCGKQLVSNSSYSPCWKWQTNLWETGLYNQYQYGRGSQLGSWKYCWLSNIVDWLTVR